MDLEKAMEKLRMQLKRFNAALGTAGDLKAQLAADCLTLETKITSTLKVPGWARSTCAHAGQWLPSCRARTACSAHLERMRSICVCAQLCIQGLLASDS